ncbi:MAG: ferrous iron transport protein A [Spirochaetes bacterium]|nr:ferrous iron transport protein A [Spirochaetota bacterium]
MTSAFEAYPLSVVPAGNYMIVELVGGRGFLRRLSYMGLHPDVEVSVTAASQNGPVRVAVGGTQFGLGRGMASRILVVSRGGADESQKGTGGRPFRRVVTLKDYREGQRGRILDIKGEGKFKKRLLDMGFTKGAEVYVEKYAPLRDPVEFIIKGYHVGLRREEAQRILMTDPY